MAEKNYKSTFGQIGCHTVNLGEFLTKFDQDYATEDGNVIKLTLKGYLALSQQAISKLKESMRECEGKELVIDLGDGAAAEILESVLRVLGFDL